MALSDEERIREIISQLPTDWHSWAKAPETSAVTSKGWRVVDWATDVVADFYGDDWFRRNLEGFSNPLFSMYDHPLANPIAVVRHIERAARIALLPGDVKEVLSTGPNGIHLSNSSNDFDHLDLVLEVMGLALRDGWEVGCEVPTARGKLPDVRVTRGGFSYSIEVTTQGFDRKLRSTQRQGDRLFAEQTRIEFENDVESVTRMTDELSDDEFSGYVTALSDAAANTAATLNPTEFDLGFASASVYPKGQRPDTTSHEGPMLTGDMWPRFGARLRTKAKQTIEGDRSWIRIDESGGLMTFTQAYHLPVEGKLGWLLHNTSLELADFPHVEGVIISHGAEPDWNSNEKELGIVESVSGSAAFDRRLPGRRRRRAYILKLRRSGITLPDHLVMNPSNWYADEERWLDWALNSLGMPAIGTAVEGEAYRKLLP